MSTKTTTTTTTVSGRGSSGSNSSVEFDVTSFEKRLRDLKDTQDSIQQLSSWCLSKRAHHKKIVSSWLNVLKQVKIESRLTLFHLANDVIQNSKRKHYEYVDSWGTYLQKATTLVRDEKVKHKILRIFKIWEEREIYNEEFLADLNGLLSVTTPAKKLQQQQQQNQQQQQQQQQQPQIASSSNHSGPTLATGPTKLAETKSVVSATTAQLDVDDYQASQLVAVVRECVKHQSETDHAFKGLNKKPHVDVEAVMNSIKGKDRKKVEEVEHEIDEHLAQYENVVEVLKTEQKSRQELLTSLQQASLFYEHQRTEVKVVVNAYRNFGNRLKSMKKRLDELTVSLPSPIPSPDINAPSPVPSDGDNILPNEDNYFQMIQHQGSYMGGGNLSFDINDFTRSDSPMVMNRVQPIQVIHSRKEQTEGVNDFLKTFFPDPSGYHGPPGSGSAGGGGVVPPSSQPPPPGIVPHPYGGGTGGGGGGGGGGFISPWASSTPRGAPPGRGNNGGYGGNGSRPSPYGGQQMLQDYGTPRQSQGVGRNAGPITQPLQPPPMPPINLDASDEYNSTWNMSMAWDGTHDSSGFQSLDAPGSPSHYDRKCMNNSGMLIDYGDGSSGDGGLMQDVDHRQLSGSMSMAPFVKEKGRLADVDHRNLISLTGSPGGPPQLKDVHDLDALDDSSSSNSMPVGSSNMRGGMHKRKTAPQPVPAPSVPSNEPGSGGRGSIWSAHGNAFSAPSNDIDLRLSAEQGPPNSALTVVPTTGSTSIGSEPSRNDTGDPESNDLDLDMRIQSLEKAIAAQIASSAVPQLSMERLGSADGGDMGDDRQQDDGENDESMQSADSAAVSGEGELNLPSLQTPVSLIEIDSFLQNFERENFEDFTKPPALLMSNQTEASQSPPATSEHSMVVVEVKRNPSDNTESVDMDLSDEESDMPHHQTHHPGDKSESPQQVSASYHHHGADENSSDAPMNDDSSATRDNQDTESPLMRLPVVNSVGSNNGIGGSNGGGANNQAGPLLQRPPLLPDPSFPPGAGPKWDLPPPNLMSLNPIMNAVIPPPPSLGALVNKLTQPPPLGTGQIWADQPPPNGQQGDVMSNRFGTPNRPPPPLPFGSGNGGNYRGGGGTPRGGRGHNRSPYFRGGGSGGGMRTNMVPGGLMMPGAGGGGGGGPFAGQIVGGTGGSPGMRGGYHRGGGNKFRGGGNNRTGW